VRPSRGPTATTGTSRATSGTATARATAGSRPGTTTSSSPRATASGRGRWRTPSSTIPTSRRSASSASPTTPAASASRRSSSRSGGVAGGDDLRTEIQERVRERLAKYEYPREVEFVDELPQTTTGKIQRRKLLDRETDG
jgi:hypothetical protein